MRTKCFSILFLLLSLQFGYGQEKRDTGNYVSFMNIPDEVIKKEIAFFSKKSKFMGYEGGLSLKEIAPYFYCDSLISFGFADTYIHVSLAEIRRVQQADTFIPDHPSWGIGNDPPKRKVESLRVVTHSHFGVEIPVSAVLGLYEPHIIGAEFSAPPKRHKRMFSNLCRKKLPVLSNYKVFHSIDKKYTYIYMLGGQRGREYEVTWVFHYSTYLYRVVDDLVFSN